MPYITKVALDNTYYTIASSLYGTCGTTASTQEKIVECTDFTDLFVGVTVRVKFTYSNSAENPTLNVNGTGAKRIYRYGTTAPSVDPESSWNAGAIIAFTYDGAYWFMNDWLNSDSGTVKSVNSIEPDENGNIDIKTVDFANNLLADDAQSSTGEYIIRTTGGDASLSDGDSWIMQVRGNRVHEGYVAESLTLTPIYTELEGRDYFIAAIDRDTWVSYVQTSGTTVFTYNGSTWSPALENYGITVNGQAVLNDRIQVEYTKEDRGTIYTASPTSFTSTGWNLYNNATGYARVVKYSETYGYKVGGTYTSVQFSETTTGTKTTLTPDSNSVVYPTKDGYIWINGGNSTSTYVYPTWSDWGSGYEGSFKAYTPSVVSLADAMSNFPYGLCRVEDIRDEIAFESKVATSRINRLAYSSSNLASVIASGMPYEYDTNYIYVVRETPITYDFTLSTNLVQAADHGLEWFDGTSVPVEATTLYGQNLKDKLRTDVVTISQQTLTEAQKTQARNNIGAGSAADVATLLASAVNNRNVINLCTWGIYATVGQTIPLTRDITQAKVVILRAGWNDSSSGLIDTIILNNQPIIGERWQALYHVDNTICYVTVEVTSATTLTVTSSNLNSLGIREVSAIF